MTKLNYKKIMDIQENATKKLLKYISQYIKNETEIDTIEFHYPNFDQDRTAIAFNVWVSLDYRTKEGKYFIEHLLEENPQSLTSLEKEILEERNKSHISLFEVVEIKNNYMYVEDLLCREIHKILEPELSTLVNTSDLIFGRIAKVIDFKKFIGDVNFLPSFAKEMFIEEALFDYNIIRRREPNLNMEEYLRKYSSNIYRIYTDCIYELLDLDDDISNQLALELEDFKMHINNKFSREKSNTYINNLINIYEYCLFEDDLTLYDLDKVSLEPLLIDAIDDGFILNQDKLNSYIDALKSYLNFLRKKETRYNKVYEEIIKISEKRFTYLDIDQEIVIPMVKNNKLISALENKLEDTSYNFLIDYKKYLAYIQINKIQVTAARKHIKRKYLIEINNFLKNKKDISHLKAPNQIDIPILHLFYEFSLNYNILRVNRNTIFPSYNFSQYLSLKEEDRLALFIEFLWEHPSWGDKSKYSLASILNQLKPNYPYPIEGYVDLYTIDGFYSKTIFTFFEAMGLLDIVETLKPQLSVTPLGKDVFAVLEAYNMNGDNENGKVIDLDKYREKE